MTRFLLIPDVYNYCRHPCLLHVNILRDSNAKSVLKNVLKTLRNSTTTSLNKRMRFEAGLATKVGVVA